jgi:hypothetical protein
MIPSSSWVGASLRSSGSTRAAGRRIANRLPLQWVSPHALEAVWFENVQAGHPGPPVRESEFGEPMRDSVGRWEAKSRTAD